MDKVQVLIQAFLQIPERYCMMKKIYTTKGREENMIKAIVFDVDDTLYDLAGPFKKTCQEMFGEDTQIDMETAFLASRKYSDEVFELSQKGGMTMEEMYIYRFQNAFRDVGKEIDKETALEFQKKYETNQQNIELTETMKELLAKLEAGIPLGIITNGPAEHQWEKVYTLGLTKWIRKEYIFVSGAMKVSKPDKKFFEAAREVLGAEASELFYVGDSFANDIEGAKNAGWHTVWLNKRNHDKNSMVEPDYTVTTEEALAECLMNIVEKKA